MSRRRGVTILEIILAVVVVGLLVWCALLQTKVHRIDYYLGRPDSGLAVWTHKAGNTIRTKDALFGAKLDFLCAGWLKVRPRGDTTVCPLTAPPVTEDPPTPPCYPKTPCPPK